MGWHNGIIGLDKIGYRFCLDLDKWFGLQLNWISTWLVIRNGLLDDDLDNWLWTWALVNVYLNWLKL